MAKMQWLVDIIKNHEDTRCDIMQEVNEFMLKENFGNISCPTGAGNIVIAMLYRRIVQCGQNPIIALSNVYGVELDRNTLNYAKKRIYKFLRKVEEHFNTDLNWKKIYKIVNHNFVCSNIFEWDIEHWRKK